MAPTSRFAIGPSIIALVTSGIAMLTPTPASEVASMITSAAMWGRRYPRSRHSECTPAGGWSLGRVTVGAGDDIRRRRSPRERNAGVGATRGLPAEPAQVCKSQITPWS